METNTLQIEKALAYFPRLLKQAYKLIADLFLQPYEPILNPSIWRLRWLALLITLGNPLFYLIWTLWLPQPYESIWMRSIIMVMGLVLFYLADKSFQNTKWKQWVFALFLWVQLPFFFSLMCFLNGFNFVWTTSVCAMVLIYYQVSDWRFASIGLFTGVALAYVCTVTFVLPIELIEGVQWWTTAMVFGFCWISAIVIGGSTANLKAVHLENTRTTMGILAHELRTPIASIALISAILHKAVNEIEEREKNTEWIEKGTYLANQLQNMVRQMNNHIDTQIANAKQSMQGAPYTAISASDCVDEVIKNYPYRSDAQRKSIALEINNDFHFQGVKEWFIQVLNNLVKNAFFAINAVKSNSDPGDLQIILSVRGNIGLVQVTDRGKGIDKAELGIIFEPFYSTQPSSSNGLGLAYCARVAQAFGGKIEVDSEVGVGTIFTVSLPLSIG